MRGAGLLSVLVPLRGASRLVSGCFGNLELAVGGVATWGGVCLDEEEEEEAADCSVGAF